MKLLAIDPGPSVCGWVLIEHGFSDGIRIIGSGSETPTKDVISMVAQSYKVSGDIDNVAVEMIASYGMPVGAEVFETCVVIGKITYAWEDWKLKTVIRVKRQESKLHLCHSPKAKDANVMQALKDRLGQVGTKKNPGPLYGISKHAWAALAVGVYAIDKMEGRNV